MHISKLDRNKFTSGYGVLMHAIVPWTNDIRPPFTSVYVVVPANGVSTPHEHHDGEVFTILSGRGEMTIGEETCEVKAGDAIYIPPFQEHKLKNSSAEEELAFITTWWVDEGTIQRELANTRPTQPGRILITAAPFTPNGDMHLGHLAGPYIAADVAHRFHTLCGSTSKFTTWADDHQSYVALQAHKTNDTAAAVAVTHGEKIRISLHSAQMSCEDFSSVHDDEQYRLFVQQFFTTLYSEGKFVERSFPQLFCENCCHFVSEAHVYGHCPHCQEFTDGNACENCCRPNDCHDLISPHCKVCNGKLIAKNCQRLYFPLSQYQQILREFQSQVQMSPQLTAICRAMFSDDLPDIAVTHPNNWGIPVPITEYQQQHIYVWVEMAAAYLFTTARSWQRPWRELWSDESIDIVQCFGLDNGYFHAFLLPALFTAYDQAIRLPKAFLTNEFYHLEGEKFSTSRGHAIWVDPFLSRVSSDAARLYVCYTRPEDSLSNFCERDFDAFARDTLANQWQLWLDSLHQRIQCQYQGKAPEAGAWLESHKKFYSDMGELLAEITRHYSIAAFSLRQAARALCYIVERAKQLGESCARFESIEALKDEWRTTIALELLAVRLLALTSYPIMPQFASDLWCWLGYQNDIATQRWSQFVKFVATNQTIGEDVPKISKNI